MDKSKRPVDNVQSQPQEKKVETKLDVKTEISAPKETKLISSAKPKKKTFSKKVLSKKKKKSKKKK